MDLVTLLWITSGVLFVILLILLIALAVSPGRREEEYMPRAERDDLRKIKDEIEQEVEEEAMRDIEPLKRRRR